MIDNELRLKSDVTDSLNSERSYIKNVQINHIISVFILINQLEGYYQRLLMVEKNLKKKFYFCISINRYFTYNSKSKILYVEK